MRAHPSQGRDQPHASAPRPDAEVGGGTVLPNRSLAHSVSYDARCVAETCMWHARQIALMFDKSLLPPRNNGTI